MCLYGGAAGGGKSYGLLLEAIRHIDNPSFGGVIFRRTRPEITNEGGLWDESEKIYTLLDGTPKKGALEWEFENGAKIKFSHMQHEKNVYSWQGSQVPFIGFDELTHFSRKQFFYMLSRNRSTCGVRPYVRATTNPSAASWVKELIEWYLDEEGYADPVKSGVIRWFINLNNEIIWGNTRQELEEKYPGEEALSFTFIAASVYDNKILLEKDPGYLSKLKALSLVERERLLGGNWKIDETAGILLREWIKFYKVLPEVKFWVWTADTAIKEGQENDYSVFQLWAICQNGYYLYFQWRGKVKYPELKSTAVNLWAQQPAGEFLIEDKASGQQLIQDFSVDKTWPIIAMMPGKNMAKSKIERMNFCSPLFEAGKIFVLEGQEWTAGLIEEWVNFPTVLHDDQVDPMTQFLSRRLKLGNAFVNDEISAPVSTGGTISEAVHSNTINQTTSTGEVSYGV